MVNAIMLSSSSDYNVEDVHAPHLRCAWRARPASMHVQARTLATAGELEWLVLCKPKLLHHPGAEEEEVSLTLERRKIDRRCSYTA